MTSCRTNANEAIQESLNFSDSPILREPREDGRATRRRHVGRYIQRTGTIASDMSSVDAVRTCAENVWVRLEE